MILSTETIGSEIKIPVGNLEVWIDAAQTNCYPKTGVDVSNLNPVKNFPGVISGGATFQTNNGGVFKFNGANQKISFTGTNDSTNIGTFVVWLKPNGNQTAFATIWLSRLTGNNVTGISYTDQGTNNFVLMWNNRQFRTVAGNIPINKWSMVAISVGPTSYRNFIYNDVDTGFIGSIAFTPANQTFDNPRMGFDTTFPARRFVGDIAIAMYYDTNLTDSQIDQIYLANKSRFIN